MAKEKEKLWEKAVGAVLSAFSEELSTKEAAEKTGQKPSLVSRVIKAAREQGLLQEAECSRVLPRRFRRASEGDPASFVWGNAVDLVVPSPDPAKKDDTLKARYALVEAENLIPSHVPSRASVFEKDPRYPLSLQERAYHADAAEARKVKQNADRFSPAFVVTDNPDGINGPPVCDENGLVLGGNSRSMSIILLYREGKAAPYVASILEKSRLFGFSKSDVARFSQPILVRVVPVDAAKNLEAGRILVRLLNRSFSQAMSPLRMASALAASVPKKTEQALASAIAQGLGEDETLNDFLRKPSSDRVRTLLFEAGILNTQNQNQFTDPKTGNLSREGRNLTGDVLLGWLLGKADRVLDSLEDSEVDLLKQLAPFVLKGACCDPAFDLRPSLIAALEAVASIKAGYGMPREESKRLAALNESFQQQGLFGGVTAVDAIRSDTKATLLCGAFYLFGDRKNRMTLALRRYATIAAKQDVSQMSFSGVEGISPEVVLMAAFDAVFTQMPYPFLFPPEREFLALGVEGTGRMMRKKGNPMQKIKAAIKRGKIPNPPQEENPADSAHLVGIFVQNPAETAYIHNPKDVKKERAKAVLKAAKKKGGATVGELTRKFPATSIRRTVDDLLVDNAIAQVDCTGVPQKRFVARSFNPAEPPFESLPSRVKGTLKTAWKEASKPLPSGEWVSDLVPVLYLGGKKAAGLRAAQVIDLLKKRPNLASALGLPIIEDPVAVGKWLAANHTFPLSGSPFASLTLKSFAGNALYVRTTPEKVQNNYDYWMAAFNAAKEAAGKSWASFFSKGGLLEVSNPDQDVLAKSILARMVGILKLAEEPMKKKKKGNPTPNPKMTSRELVGLGGEKRARQLVFFVTSNKEDSRIKPLADKLAGQTSLSGKIAALATITAAERCALGESDAFLRYMGENPLASALLRPEALKEIADGLEAGDIERETVQFAKHREKWASISEAVSDAKTVFNQLKSGGEETAAKLIAKQPPAIVEELRRLAKTNKLLSEIDEGVAEAVRRVEAYSRYAANPVSNAQLKAIVAKYKENRKGRKKVGKKGGKKGKSSKSSNPSIGLKPNPEPMKENPGKKGRKKGKKKGKKKNPSPMALLALRRDMSLQNGVTGLLVQLASLGGGFMVTGGLDYLAHLALEDALKGGMGQKGARIACSVLAGGVAIGGGYLLLRGAAERGQVSFLIGAAVKTFKAIADASVDRKEDNAATRSALGVGDPALSGYSWDVDALKGYEVFDLAGTYANFKSISESEEVGRSFTSASMGAAASRRLSDWMLPSGSPLQPQAAIEGVYEDFAVDGAYENFEEYIEPPAMKNGGAVDGTYENFALDGVYADFEGVEGVDGYHTDETDPEKIADLLVTPPGTAPQRARSPLGNSGLAPQGAIVDNWG